MLAMKDFVWSSVAEYFPQDDARPTLGIMAVISSDSSAGTMVRRLLPAVLLLPAALGALRAIGSPRKST